MLNIQITLFAALKYPIRPLVLSFLCRTCHLIWFYRFTEPSQYFLYLFCFLFLLMHCSEFASLLYFTTTLVLFFFHFIIIPLSFYIFFRCWSKITPFLFTQLVSNYLTSAVNMLTPYPACLSDTKSKLLNLNFLVYVCMALLQTTSPFNTH